MAMVAGVDDSSL